MKTYQGSINFDGTRQVQVISGTSALLLLRHGHNIQHAYAWGNPSNAGPLAYDILLDAVSEEAADELSDLFRKRVLAKLNGEEAFTLDYYDVKQFVDDNMPPDEAEAV